MKHSVEIIGISGKIGSGKDFITNEILLPLLTTCRPGKLTLIMALADHLKVEVCCKSRRSNDLPFTYDSVFGPKDEESRKALQYRGTERNRKKYGEDIWTRIIEMWIRCYADKGLERVIITDIRFLSDFKWVKDMGGQVIRIIAPNRTLNRIGKETSDPVKQKEIMSHRSEIELDSLPLTAFDAVFNNDYCDESTIYAQVALFVNRQMNSSNPTAAVIIFCSLEAISKCDPSERKDIISSLNSIGKLVILINGDQIDETAKALQLGLKTYHFEFLHNILGQLKLKYAAKIYILLGDYDLTISPLISHKFISPQIILSIRRDLSLIDH